MNRIRRFLLLVLFLLVLPVAGLWMYLAQPTIGRGARSGAQVEPARLREHVVALSERFHPRTANDSGNTARCVDYIAAQFAAAGGRVEMQDYRAGPFAHRNVRCFFGTNVADRVVVGAHYDTFMFTPGADDNASGVAGLIELAVLLGRTNTAAAVELVAYGTEEPPFFGSDDMGSARHAGLLEKEKARVRAVLVLEMIGCFSDEPGSQAFPIPLLNLIYPSRGDFIGVVGRPADGALIRRVKSRMQGATDLPVHSIRAPSFVPGVDLSDQRSYWVRGRTAVMITDTALFRNKRYHEAGDTADTLDYDRMPQVVAGVYEAVLDLAR